MNNMKWLELLTNKLQSNTFLISESLAQLVEQRPFKPWVAGSSPARLTMYCCVPIV
jgi:hypothetical protein